MRFSGKWFKANPNARFLASDLGKTLITDATIIGKELQPRHAVEESLGHVVKVGSPLVIDTSDALLSLLLGQGEAEKG